MRSGSEPVTARSALRMRFWLSVWGVLSLGGGAAAFSVVGRTGWAAACAALALVAVVNLVVVVHRIRQGPRYQPGRDVPPYRPPRRRRLSHRH